MEERPENSEELENHAEYTFVHWEEGSTESRFLYAKEKLGMAVWKLATGRNGIKSRLADAYIELAIIQESDMPPELWEELCAIRRELTRGKMQYDTRIGDGRLMKEPAGQLMSTLRFMRLERAQHIARRICNLEAKAERWMDEEM